MSDNGRNELGLDELMIVNPDAGGLSAVFLGGDGALYGVEDAGDGRFFLGDDGGLYRIAGEEPRSALQSEENGAQFFLGDDGTLYQVTSGSPR